MIDGEVYRKNLVLVIRVIMVLMEGPSILWTIDELKERPSLNRRPIHSRLAYSLMRHFLVLLTLALNIMSLTALFVQD